MSIRALARDLGVAVRSGATDLGRWLDEERVVYTDYRSIIGGPASSVVRVG